MSILKILEWLFLGHNVLTYTIYLMLLFALYFGFIRRRDK